MFGSGHAFSPPKISMKIKTPRFNNGLVVTTKYNQPYNVYGCQKLLNNRSLFCRIRKIHSICHIIRHFRSKNVTSANDVKYEKFVALHFNNHLISLLFTVHSLESIREEFLSGTAVVTLGFWANKQ